MADEVSGKKSAAQIEFLGVVIPVSIIRYKQLGGKHYDRPFVGKRRLSGGSVGCRHFCRFDSVTGHIEVDLEAIMRAIVMSIHPKWVSQIASGEKLFELRRRPPQATENYDAFIYATSPIRAIILRCRFAPADSGTLDELWMSVRDKCCVGETEYKAYFNGVSQAHAIPIISCAPLSRHISLKEMTDRCGLKAPQSWAYCPDMLASLLQEAL